MERSAYLSLLQRWKWVLLIAVVVAGLVGYLSASQIPPTYEANARLLVGPVNTDVNTVRAAESLTLTYAELATAEPTLRRVADALDLDFEEEKLANVVTVNAVSTTRILSVRVTGNDPEQIALIANTLASEMIEVARDTLDRPEGRLHAIDPAVPPTEPIAPNVILITFLTAMAGLLAAALLAVAIEYFGNSVKDSGDLADVTPWAVLGEVNVNHGYRGTPAQPLVVEARPESKTALAYRLLASRLPLGGTGENPVRSILVVGSQTGEQVGEFAANLAAVLARTGRSVTLVDADDLEAHVTAMFVPGWRTGLSDVIGLAPEDIKTTDVLDDIRVKRPPGIDLIPSGRGDSLTAREDTVAAVLEKLEGRTDMVVISSAPIHRSAQSLLWARHSDGVLVVASADTTSVENVRYAVESLRLVQARVLGSVLLVHKSMRAGRWQRRREPERVSTLSSAVPSEGPMAEPRAVGDKGVG